MEDNPRRFVCKLYIVVVLQLEHGWLINQILVSENSRRRWLDVTQKQKPRKPSAPIKTTFFSGLKSDDPFFSPRSIQVLRITNKRDTRGPAEPFNVGSLEILIMLCKKCLIEIDSVQTYDMMISQLVIFMFTDGRQIDEEKKIQIYSRR